MKKVFLKNKKPEEHNPEHPGILKDGETVAGMLSRIIQKDPKIHKMIKKGRISILR